MFGYTCPTVADWDGNLVAATDANRQGDIYADRIRAHAATAGCRFSRLRRQAED